MPTRQYIGARYVPKIFEHNGSSDWVSGIAYEPLTIVTYLNNSYTSKKPVPSSVGSPNNNPNYWVCTGDYSGTVDSLTQLINGVSDDVTALSGRVDTIDDNLTDLTNNVVRKFAIITDSYGVPSQDWTKTFVEVFQEDMKLTVGTDFCYRARGGAGFVANTVQFSTVIQELAAYMPSGMLTSDITDLLILGGCNDSYITDHASLMNAIRDTVALAKSLFTNARIYIGVTGGLGTLTRKLNMEDNVIPYYMNCERYGAIPIPNLEYIMTNKSFFLDDNTHPTNYAQSLIGHALANAFNCGYSKVGREQFTFARSTGTLTAGNSYARVYNSMVDLDIRGITLHLGSAQDLGREFTLCTFTNDIVYGNNIDWFDAEVTCGGGSKDFRGIVPIILNDGDMLIEFPVNDINAEYVQFNRVHSVMSLMNC